MKSASFTIHTQLCDLNNYINAERGNRFAAAKIKKENTEIVYFACLEAFGLKPKQFKNPVYIYIDWYVPNKRKEKDNVAFAKKFILDGMVKAGVLRNDGFDDIDNFADNFYVDAKKPRVEVQIEEVVSKPE